MDITSLIVGVLLTLITLSFSRFLWLLRLALSSLTSLPILKFSYPDLHIWWPKEYTDVNFSILFHSNYFIWGIVYASISFLFFYWALPMILQRLITRTIEVKFQAIFNSMTPHQNRWIERLFRRIYSLVFRWMFMLRIYRPIHILPATEEAPTYNEYSIIIIRFFVLFLNIIAVITFVFHQYGVFALIAMLLAFFVMSLVILFIPFYLFFRATIARVVIEQNNHYVR